jgi:hypothetical protein
MKKEKEVRSSLPYWLKIGLIFGIVALVFSSISFYLELPLQSPPFQEKPAFFKILFYPVDILTYPLFDYLLSQERYCNPSSTDMGNCNTFNVYIKTLLALTFFYFLLGSIIGIVGQKNKIKKI